MAANPLLGGLDTGDYADNSINRGATTGMSTPRARSRDQPSSGASDGLSQIPQETKDRIASARDEVDHAGAKLSFPHLTPAPPQEAVTDPFQAFGQPAMWIAAFGSLFTRRPLVAAINAAGEVLKSTHEQDIAGVKRNYEIWKVNNENAIKMANFERDAYKASLQHLHTEAAVGEAMIKTNIAAFQNKNLEYINDTQGPEGVKKYLGKHDADVSLLMERSMRLQEMQERHMDQLAGMQAWDAENPMPQDPAAQQQWQLHRALAHAEIRAGKDPDEVKGGAAGAGEHDVELLAKNKFKELNGRDPGPDDAAAMAGLRQEGRGAAAATKQDALAIDDDSAQNYAILLHEGKDNALSGLARNQANMKKVSTFYSGLINKDIADGRLTREQANREVMARTGEYHGLIAGESTAGRRSATVELPAAEAQKVIPLVLGASEKVDRTQYSSLNAVMQAAERGSGDTNVVNLAQGVNSLINIYSRVISPTGNPTVSDKDHARDILSAAWSKGQLRSAIDFMQKEISAAREAPPEVTKSMRDNFTGAKPARPAGPKEGDSGTSKSGKPTVYRDGAWHYAE